MPRAFSHPLLVALLLLSFFLLGLAGVRHASVTVDEFAHLPAGAYYHETGNFYLFAKNPPLVKYLMTVPLLASKPNVDRNAHVDQGGWTPWIFGYDFMEKNRASYLDLFFRARVVVLCLGLLLGFLVYRWAREEYGPAGGLISLLLFAFEPNLLAHAGLATVDVGCALGMFAAVYAFRTYLRRPSWRTLLAAGVLLGSAELTKYTAVLLYPLLMLLAGVFLVRTGKGSPLRPWRLAGALGLIFLVSVVVINAGYGFQDTMRPAGSYRLESESSRRAVALLPAGLPLPLPGPYIEGFDALRADTENGEFPNYLLGSWSQRGWRYYFPLTMAWKLSPALLLVLVVAPFVRRPADEASVSPAGEFVVWLPPLVLLLLFSLFVHTNYGIRYLLPVFPFLLVYAGRLGQVFRGGPKLLRVALAALLCLYPLSALTAAPAFLSYFNLLAGGTNGGHRYLLDSNVDWGQELPTLREFMTKNRIDRIGLVYFGHVDPALYGIDWDLPETRISPYVAVSANFLHGYPYPIYRKGEMIDLPPGRYAWLLGKKPVAILDGSLFVYRFDDWPAELATPPPYQKAF
ncbi:MAG TPA: glycosyltransferase family 39 protein [Geobacteraceae bacterium]